MSLDCSSDCPNICIVSQDHHSVFVKKDALVHSGMLDAAFTNDDSTISVAVDGETLKHCCKWLEMLSEGHKPVINKPLRGVCGVKDDLDPVTADFLCQVAKCEDKSVTKNSKNKQGLYNLVKAADYLIIETLCSAACAFVASMVKACPVDELEKILKP